MTGLDHLPDFALRHIAEKDLRSIAVLAGAEHEHQYMHGGCPECGCFYDNDKEWSWQHFAGCGRATDAEPARKPYSWETG
jgi:hypothetical protein